MYEEEYQIFVKEITEKYISFTKGDCPVKTWDGHGNCDNQYVLPTEKEEKEFHKKRNIDATNWLNKNMITYNEWLKKYKNGK